jgi:hypothetical protein
MRFVEGLQVQEIDVPVAVHITEAAEETESDRVAACALNSACSTALGRTDGLGF